MLLKGMALQNFRSYESGVFHFGEGTTVVVGENAAGKTNFLEAVYLLSMGKSFRAEKDWQLLQFEKSVGRVKGKIQASNVRYQMSDEKEEVDLEVVLAAGESSVLKKKYLVNGVSRRRLDFAGKLSVVLFVPDDMDLVGGSPSLRRNFLDEVLEQVDLDYRLALQTYTKALRQRNALLEQVQETGVRNESQLVYWNGLLIENGQLITKKRREVIEYINKKEKEFFQFELVYDVSEISNERLAKYKQAEIGAGVTLVGPHRDDLVIQISDFRNRISEKKEAKYFASRGQQRLIVLEMKLAQINYIEDLLKHRPVLLLDDIFSELDSKHIGKVLEMIKKQQTIVTTTHKEFVKDLVGSQVQMVQLEKNVGLTEKIVDSR
jgi:DNA replication and repair protein RecF